MAYRSRAPVREIRPDGPAAADSVLPLHESPAVMGDGQYDEARSNNQSRGAEMKLKMDEWTDDEGRTWVEGGDYEVEIPDAIVDDWRESEKHLSELYAYFDEKVRPQIDKIRAERMAEWKRTHPEDARRHDLLVEASRRVSRRWQDLLFNHYTKYQVKHG